MASNASTKKLAGIVLLVLGVGLLYMGYQESQTLGAELSNAIGGGKSDREMQFYIGGAISTIIGVFLIFKN
ncbi:MAG: hypothetical protein ACI97A_002914 [Planctomycetota bacterium]|jgi:hypothetical protein